MNKTTKIAIIGASGHLGITLLNSLKTKGYEDIKAISAPNEKIPESFKPLADWYLADIRNKAKLAAILSDRQLVFHLASLITIANKPNLTIYKINVQGTINIAQICSEYNIQRLVYVSTVHVFEVPEKPKQKIVETLNLNPKKLVGQYAQSKAKAVQELLKFKDLDFVIVHPSGIIGPNDFKESAMGKFFRNFLSHKMIAYVSGAYDFVDVRDVSKGIISAAEFGKRGENYLLSGHFVQIGLLLKILEHFSAIKAPKMKFPLFLARLIAPFVEFFATLFHHKPSFTSYSIYTLTHNALVSKQKASEFLNYKVRPLTQTIKDTLQWLKEEDKKIMS